MPAPIRRVDELGFPIPAKFEDFQTGDPEPRPPRRSIFKRLGRWRWLILLLLPALLFGPQAVDFVRGIVANIQLDRAEQDVRQRNFPRAVFHASRAIAWEPDPQRRSSPKDAGPAAREVEAPRRKLERLQRSDRAHQPGEDEARRRGRLG